MARGKTCLLAPACRDVAYTSLPDLCAYIFFKLGTRNSPVRLLTAPYYMSVLVCNGRPPGKSYDNIDKVGRAYFGNCPSTATRVPVRSALLPS